MCAYARDKAVSSRYWHLCIGNKAAANRFQFRANRRASKRSLVGAHGRWRWVMWNAKEPYEACLYEIQVCRNATCAYVTLDLSTQAYTHAYWESITRRQRRRYTHYHPHPFYTRDANHRAHLLKSAMTGPVCQQIKAEVSSLCDALPSWYLIMYEIDIRAFGDKLPRKPSYYCQPILNRPSSSIQSSRKPYLNPSFRKF